MSEKAVNKFGNNIRKWELGWVDIFIEWKGQQNIQQSVNDWLNDFEAEWAGGMGKVNTSFGAEGAKEVTSGLTKKEFVAGHGSQIQATTAKDGIVGRAERNMMALTFKNRLIDMFKEFDKIVENGSGIPLPQKVKLFMQQPTFKDTVHLFDTLGRKWTPGNYATMYARTKGGETYTANFLSEMVASGGDVVQISPTATDTPICSQYVGRYFSLKGQTPGLPILDITPPFHPNCVHIMLEVSPDKASEYRKENTSREKTFRSDAKDFSTAQKNSIKKSEDYIRLNRPVKVGQTV